MTWVHWLQLYWAANALFVGFGIGRWLDVRQMYEGGLKVMSPRLCATVLYLFILVVSSLALPFLVVNILARRR